MHDLNQLFPFTCPTSSFPSCEPRRFPLVRVHSLIIYSYLSSITFLHPARQMGCRVYFEKEKKPRMWVRISLMTKKPPRNPCSCHTVPDTSVSTTHLLQNDGIALEDVVAVAIYPCGCCGELAYRLIPLFLGLASMECRARSVF
jgi:hypothetical protein